MQTNKLACLHSVTCPCLRKKAWSALESKGLPADEGLKATVSFHLSFTVHSGQAGAMRDLSLVEDAELAFLLAFPQVACCILSGSAQLPNKG